MTEDEDISTRGWAPVTVRVATTLVTAGVHLGPDVLRHARDHVWLHLPPDTPVDVAVDRAEPLTLGFVARAFGRPVVLPFPEDADHPLPLTWRRMLQHDLSENARHVLRMHLADGFPLEQVAAWVGEDALALEAAREGLREALQAAARQDGRDLESWSGERLDHLLHRLVALPAGPEPPLLEVVDGLHPEHTARSVRAGRAYNLVRKAGMNRAELVAPHGASRPRDRVRLLVLHLHPAARHHRATLAAELGCRTFPMHDGLLLVDAADLDAVLEVLHLAAEVEAPGRDHLRGALVEGPGRWSPHGLLGPLATDAAASVRALPWGTLHGAGELPAPLPAPPSARWVWASVAALGLCTALLSRAAFAPDPPPVDRPLLVETTPARQGFWLGFDVEEDAYVVIVRERAHALDVVLDSRRPVDKIRHATGDGSYRLHTVGDAVLVASTARPVPDLDGLVDAVAAEDLPLDALAARLRAVDPKADVRLARR
ncbi:MAG: hypothetical protein H6732_06060 [Alphaproteobacteria bacterium]|nr:hypothetical protein [Alphaproteobacteria bacterium]